MTEPVLRAIDASGRQLDDPTDTEVHDLFADLNAGCPFVIVKRLDEPARQFYFQVHLDYVGDQNPDADERPAQVVRTGDCDWALAGGVCVRGDPTVFLEARELGALSDDGHCRSFADGARSLIARLLG
ncbi:beta-ketoacyl synthase N-terminal-like domain-containing protein [Nocardia vinacea]|uniref:beta-ketoacyl synthase N-terminal-like domain-containing protein n=1 Tax=Nocardia vinacea TaxID=96468 RepID=UPI002E34B646|nr:beta-ketoacyl synthase N-terminal-like domain-containing protein [Nocardia vinacea]